VALFKAAARLHAACIRAGGDVGCMGTGSAADVAALRTFERLLMTVGEHTWGWNGGDTRRHSWSNPQLKESLATNPQFQTAVLTWVEQRAFIRNAVAALPSASPLARAVTAEFAAIEGYNNAHFDAAGFVDHPVGTELSCGSLAVRFAVDGSIISLRDAQGDGTKYAFNCLLYPLYVLTARFPPCGLFSLVADCVLVSKCACPTGP
jgi:hypothetical protein